MLWELHWLQDGMNGNVSMFISPWVDRKSCTGSRSIFANKNFFGKPCVSLQWKYTQPTKKGYETSQVPSVCHLCSSREVSLLSHNGNSCPVFNAYFYSYLHFSWHARSGSRGTAPWSGGRYYGRSVVPRLGLAPRLPLIGIATILWPTLSYK